MQNAGKPSPNVDKPSEESVAMLVNYGIELKIVQNIYNLEVSKASRDILFPRGLKAQAVCCSFSGRSRQTKGTLPKFEENHQQKGNAAFTALVGLVCSCQI